MKKPTIMKSLKAEAEVPTPPLPPTPPPMPVKVWRKQPDIELALHPSVSETIATIEKEQIDLQSRIEKNSHALAKIIAGQISHYKLSVDRTRQMTWRDNYSVMCVPQPDKQEVIQKTED